MYKQGSPVEIQTPKPCNMISDSMTIPLPTLSPGTTFLIILSHSDKFGHTSAMLLFHFFPFSTSLKLKLCKSGRVCIIRGAIKSGAFSHELQQDRSTSHYHFPATLKHQSLSSHCNVRLNTMFAIVLMIFQIMKWNDKCHPPQ